VDGRLVAFDSIFVVDAGKTVLAKALRVDEAYRYSLWRMWQRSVWTPFWAQMGAHLRPFCIFY
jgi:hypothetical protein